MRILIVAATSKEIDPFIIKHAFTKSKTSDLLVSKKLAQVRILITGVGMVNTAFFLGKYLNAHFDLAINAGICGAFKKTIAIGETVCITEEVISEMGAEDGADFIKHDTLSLGGSNRYLLKSNIKPAPLKQLKKVKGITVNTVHGNTRSIKSVVSLYDPDVESMEGAAFAMACSAHKVNAIELRSISNRVERRNRSKRNMALAVKNLNEKLSSLIRSL